MSTLTRKTTKKRKSEILKSMYETACAMHDVGCMDYHIYKEITELIVGTTTSAESTSNPGRDKSTQ